MKNLNKVYAIVCEAGSYDSYQDTTLGVFIDKQQCLSFMSALVTDIQEFVGNNKLKYKQSKLEAFVDVSFEFARVTVTEPTNWKSKSGMMYPGMAALLKFLGKNHPKLGWTEEDEDYSWATNGDLSLSVREIDVWDIPT